MTANYNFQHNVLRKAFESLPTHELKSIIITQDTARAKEIFYVAMEKSYLGLFNETYNFNCSFIIKNKLPILIYYFDNSVISGMEFVGECFASVIVANDKNHYYTLEYSFENKLALGEWATGNHVNHGFYSQNDIENIIDSICNLCTENELYSPISSQNIASRTNTLYSSMDYRNIDITRNEQIEILLKRVFMFLEDGDFDRADEFCEQVLNLNPECAEAYLGKLMAEFHICNKESLKDLNVPYYESNNYKRTLMFASSELADALKEITCQNKLNIPKKPKRVLAFSKNTGLIWSFMGLISFLIMFFDFYEGKTWWIKGQSNSPISYSGIEACFLEVGSHDFEFYFTPFCIVSILLSFSVILTGLISFFNNKFFKKIYIIESVLLLGSSTFILLGHFCDGAAHLTRIGMYMHVFWSICIITYLFVTHIIGFKKQ